jgi:glutaredoxin-like protein NrdH
MLVTVYTLPSCVQCDSTKRVLQRNSVSYNEIDLSVDNSAMDMVRELGYTAAPVVVAGDEHWSGFRPDKLSNLSS